MVGGRGAGGGSRCRLGAARSTAAGLAVTGALMAGTHSLGRSRSLGRSCGNRSQSPFSFSGSGTFRFSESPGDGLGRGRAAGRREGVRNEESPPPMELRPRGEQHIRKAGFASDASLPHARPHPRDLRGRAPWSSEPGCRPRRRSTRSRAGHSGCWGYFTLFLGGWGTPGTRSSPGVGGGPPQRKRRASASPQLWGSITRRLDLGSGRAYC